MNAEAIRTRAVAMMTGKPEPPCEPGYRLHHGQRVETLALDTQAERLPAVTRHPCLTAGKLDALAVYHTVKAHIVLQRIGAGDVVVARIAGSAHLRCDDVRHHPDHPDRRGIGI